MKKKLPKNLQLSKSRAAGMAFATRGKAKAIEEKTDTGDEEEEIEEGLEEYKRRKGKNRVS